nr:MAG TPA: hypothetical protein [Caudoviricetes sp.]
MREKSHGVRPFITNSMSNQCKITDRLTMALTS